jgi:hypothetical protein
LKIKSVATQFLAICIWIMELSSAVHTSIFCEGILFLIVFSASQVGQLREVSNKAHNAELKLFLEVELGLVMILVLCFLLYYLV